MGLTRALHRTQKRHRAGGTKTFVKHALLICVTFVTLYPVLWMLKGSVSPETEIATGASLIPQSFSVQNYIDGWSANPPGMGRFFTNSLLVSIGATLGNLISCTLAAYAFARLRFPAQGLLFGLMLATVMLPPHATLVPQYTLFSALGWVDTFLPLVVPKFVATDAFFIFLLTQFMRSLPREFDEAAELDGCSYFGTFIRVIIPMCKPALATTAVFSFLWTYEDFLLPLVYLADTQNYTVPLGLRMFVNSMGESSYGQLFAMSALSLLPVFILFVIFQRQLVEGIASTGLKG
jgi:multiple sugar transport system permease protein